MACDDVQCFAATALLRRVRRCFAGLVADPVIAIHAALCRTPQHSAPAHGAHAELRPDALVLVSGHVLIQHADGLFRVC